MRIGKPLKPSRAWKKAGSSKDERNLNHRRHSNESYPRHVTAETIVGQISPDLVTTLVAPRLHELAMESLERYASDCLVYEDALADFRRTREANDPSDDDGVEIDVHGNAVVSEEERQRRPIPPAPPLFHSQSSIDRWTAICTETSEYFSSSGKSTGGWKIHANAARFERSLDEKYGIFRPFITDHPEVEQYIRSVQRQYAMGYFSPVRTPPMPRATAVILLFMMHRGKLQWEVLLLATLFFLVGLQPWALVAMVSLVQALLYRRKRQTVGTMARRIQPTTPYYDTLPTTKQCDTDDEDDSTANTTTTGTDIGTRSNEEIERHKHDLLLAPVGTPLDQTPSTLLNTDNYDVILLGHGPGTLFTGALLARAGRKVLVLSSRHDASGCLTFLNAPAPSEPRPGSGNSTTSTTTVSNLPFDVEFSNVPKVSRQQELLAPALVSTTDCQGGVRFAKIGSQADGYAFEIVSVPGMGSDGSDHHVPFILKGSGGAAASLIEDAAVNLGDTWPESDTDSGDSRTGQFVTACEAMNDNASLFYLSKVLPESVNKLRTNTSYHDATLRDCTTLLNTCFPLNAHLRSLMAAIGMKGENLSPQSTSMAAFVTNVCATLNAEGMHYPIGGPRALCHALAHVIVSNGGRVVSSAPVEELAFDTTIPTKRSTKPTDPAPPYCVGVNLRSPSTGESIRLHFGRERFQMKQPPHCPVVISTEGFLQTFIRWLPDEIRSTYKVPRGVPALSERRPIIHFLVALNGSANELSVTGADYYRLPGAALARDEVDPETGETVFGTIGWSEMDYPSDQEETVDPSNIESTINAEEASNDEPTTTNASETRRKKKRHAKFETGQSWLRISFPSAKDPSFATRHGNVTTCVVSLEADDDFVALYDTKPKLFVIKKRTASTAGDIQRLTERVRKDLVEIYPQLEGKILHSELCGPFQNGLSHNPERYAAKGIRTDTPYPGLYAGGNDLTVGDSFSGAIAAAWLVTNAVCGYKAVDHLFLNKNITTDLNRFLSTPTALEDEDIAVPYTPIEVEVEAEENVSIEEQ